MNKQEINQVFSERLEVKNLEVGQIIEFTTKSNTSFDGTHRVEIVGFLDIGEGTSEGIHDVVVSEKHEHHSLLALLSSYDSNFYEFEQEYIEVHFCTDED